MDGDQSHQAYDLAANKEQQGGAVPSDANEPATVVEKAPPDPNAPRYELRPGCTAGVGAAATGAQVCLGGCPPGEVSYRVWQIAPVEVPMQYECLGAGEARVAGDMIVTPDLVLRAFREIPLPRHRSLTQPEVKTLVNFETIFYTKAEPLTRIVTILGQRVRLEIEPSRFAWDHGDGTTAVTRVPGAPYPAKTIVHKYADAYATFAHRLTITWTARYAAGDGPLRPVPGTVSTTSVATPLRVAEAVPSLVASDGR